MVTGGVETGTTNITETVILNSPDLTCRISTVIKVNQLGVEDCCITASLSIQLYGEQHQPEGLVDSRIYGFTQDLTPRYRYCREKIGVS